MTKEELLALGLTEEQTAKVVEDYGKNYVSKDQFNAKNEELKSVKGELTTLNSEIDNLKKSNADNAELAKQIETMKADAESRKAEYENKIAQLEIDNIVNVALSNAKAKNNVAVRALLDLTDAKVKDGKIKGLDEQLAEQLAEVAKANPYLFGEASVPKGVAPGNPGGKAPSGAVTKEDFAKMTYSQRAELFANDIDLYNSLTGGNANE